MTACLVAGRIMDIADGMACFLQIIQEGFMDFGSILGFIKPSQMQDPKGSTIIVAMKAVALISQRRPRLLGRGLPALLNIPSHNPGSASVQSNLKVCLLSMLKNTDADAVPWRKRVSIASTPKQIKHTRGMPCAQPWN